MLLPAFFPRVKLDISRISLDRFHSFACSVVVPWVSFTWNCLIQIFTSCVAPRIGGDDSGLEAVSIPGWTIWNQRAWQDLLLQAAS